MLSHWLAQAVCHFFTIYGNITCAYMQNVRLFVEDQSNCISDKTPVVY